MTRLRPAGFGEARAHDARVQAIVDVGFTERQARFLVLVLRHAGVCVPRQYASFGRIANGGRRCNAFFDKHVRRGYASEHGCVHKAALPPPSQSAVSRRRRGHEPLPPSDVAAPGR